MIESASKPRLRDDQREVAIRDNSRMQAEYNAAAPCLRPVDYTDVPIMVDHVGPCPPHPMNIKKCDQLNERLNEASFKRDMNESSAKNFSPVPSSTNRKTTLAPPIGDQMSYTQSSSRLAFDQAQRHGKVQHASTVPSLTGFSSRHGGPKKSKQKKPVIKYDEYGAREGASQEEQVKAIVAFFQRIVHQGSFRINPGKPRQRTDNPLIAQGSDQKLLEYIGAHVSQLEYLIHENDEASVKQHSQIYLGAFDQSSINLYEELDKLKQMLARAKQRVIDQRMRESESNWTSSTNVLAQIQNQQTQHKKKRDEGDGIAEIVQKIDDVLKRMANRGPEIPEKLRSFISVEQVMSKEYPDHLPDIQKEGVKILQQNQQMSKRDSFRSSPQKKISALQAIAIQQQPTFKDKGDDKDELSNFFKPYDKAQLIVFPEQARIKNKRLQIYRYELGDGLVDAISHRIEQTMDPNEVLNELILDQNNLSDTQIARILKALLIQATKNRQACQAIYISNNELGPESVAMLLKFFLFQNPDHLCELSLTNLRLTENLVSDLFLKLQTNFNLLKLRLANTNLQGSPSTEMLCSFLRRNDLLTDVDLSYCQFSIEQMTQIFLALRGSLSLNNLNLAFNMNEYSRSPEQSQELFDAMVDLFEHNQKLVHLDLSGLNLGAHILKMAPALIKSLTLQAIHLHNNGILRDVLMELYDIFRIRLGVRRTKTEFQANTDEEESEEHGRATPKKDLSKYVIAEEGKVDVYAAEQKMGELKKDSLRLEATQFHGVGRRPVMHEKLILIRILGHQELNLFHQYNVSGWQVSPVDSCYICEGWKYTIFFYDRRKHIKNKLLDCVSRWILERLNYHLRSDHKRRAPPQIVAPTLIPVSGALDMSSTLEFVARMNRTVCFLLEQAQVNASRTKCPYDILLKLFLQNKVNVADNIALSMDLDVNDLVYKSLRYPDDSEVIDLPEQSNYFSREMEDDQTYIWAGFAKPGKHTVVIHDPLNLDGVVKQTFLVGVRKKDLLKQTAPQLESIEEIMKQGASRLDSTILFSNWKRDKTSSYDQCFNFDFPLVKAIEQMAASQAELQDCKNYIKSGYADFIKSYSILAAHSAHYPLIDKPRFEIFCNKLNILSSHLTMDSCFKIFTRITGISRGLSRPQFLIAILKLVFAKFLRPKAQKHMQRMIKRMSSSLTHIKLPQDLTISDLSSGVRLFFEKLLPGFARKRTWQEFRAIVQKPKTSQILINNMTILRRVYSQWSEIYNNKRRFTIEHSVKLFEFIKHVNKKHPLQKMLVISDQQLMSCWGLSKITVKDMDRDFDRSKHMVFVEFLEFICRVAHVANFVDYAKNGMFRGKYDSSCGEDETFKRAELSQGSDREDAREDMRFLNVDSDSSEDADFVITEANQPALTNFSFLFHRSTMKGQGKKHRVKLKWLVSLFPAVHKKYERQKAAQPVTIAPVSQF